MTRAVLASVVPLAAAGALLSPEFRHPAPPQTALHGRRATVVHWPGDSAAAARLLRGVERLAPLPALPPGVPRTPVRIVLAPSEAVLDSLLAGRAPEWGAGFAVPAARTIILPGYPSNRTRFEDPFRVLRHEWAHLALHDHLGPARVPRWFDEGYATWATGEWSATGAWKLRFAFLLGRVPPLDSLDLRFPADAASAEMAYLLSATAVEYLVRESGVRGLEVFLGRWRESGAFDAALRSTYGVTLSQFEEDWRKYVKRRYGWLLVLSHSAIFWLALTLLFLLLVWIRRRRDRRRLARLRATEPPDRPAFWEPDFRPPRGEGREGEGPAEGRREPGRGGG